MSFSDIPVRVNADKILHSWFNALRTAGIAVENFLGAGFIIETEFDINNNQTSWKSIVGLSFDNASYKSAKIIAEIRRKTDATERVSIVDIYASYFDLEGIWILSVSEVGSESGVTFNITDQGQIQYKSDEHSGANYTGTIKFKAETFRA